MQSDLEVRLVQRERRRLLGGRIRHDERRRADHPAAMRFEDAARYAGAEAEVIGGHDDPPREHPRTSLRRVRVRAWLIPCARAAEVMVVPSAWTHPDRQSPPPHCYGP